MAEQAKIIDKLKRMQAIVHDCLRILRGEKE